jgi:SAM-dependent methyltransferase
MSVAALPCKTLLDSASAYYRASGRFAWHFARGKLRADTAYRLILEQGLLAGSSHLLDLGAGQGLLAAWLLAARSCHASGRVGAWPQRWPAPPLIESYTGIEINPKEVYRARRAFALAAAAEVRMLHADIRDADYGRPDGIVLLDVLHYNDFSAQERILGRARAALCPGGALLVRIGDAAGGHAFTLSKALDQGVALMRRRRWLSLHCRTLGNWQALLGALGFSTRTVAVSRGSAFTNTLLIGRAA